MRLHKTNNTIRNYNVFIEFKKYIRYSYNLQSTLYPTEYITTIYRMPNIIIKLYERKNIVFSLNVHTKMKNSCTKCT